MIPLKQIFSFSLFLLLPLLGWPQSTSNLSVQTAIPYGDFAGFSSDGKYAIIGNKVIDLKKGAVLHENLTTPSALHEVAILPDNQYVVSYGRGGICLSNLITGELVEEFSANLQTYSKDGTLMAYHFSSTQENTDEIVYLKQLPATEDSVAIHTGLDLLRSIALSPNKDKLAVIGRKLVLDEKEKQYILSPFYLKVIDLQTGREILHFQVSDDIFNLELIFSDGGTYVIISLDKKMLFVDLKTGKKVDWLGSAFKGRSLLATWGTQLWFSSDDRYLIAKTPTRQQGGIVKLLRFFDLSEGQKKWEKRIKGGNYIAVNSNFKEAAYVTIEDAVKQNPKLNILGIFTGKEIFVQPIEMAVGGVGFTADGNYLVFVDYGKVNYLELESKQEVKRQENLKTVFFMDLALDHTGGSLIYPSEKGIKSLQMLNGFQVIPLSIDTGYVTFFSWHEEQNLLAYFWYDERNKSKFITVEKPTDTRTIEIPDRESVNRLELDPTGNYLCYHFTLLSGMNKNKSYNRVVNVKTQNVLGDIEGHTTIMFSKDGRFIYRVGYQLKDQDCKDNVYDKAVDWKKLRYLEQYNTALQKIDIESGEIVNCFKVEDQILTTAISKDRKYLAIISQEFLATNPSSYLYQLKIIDENLQLVRSINVEDWQALDKVFPSVCFHKDEPKVNVFLSNSISFVGFSTFDFLTGEETDRYVFENGAISPISTVIASNDRYLFNTSPSGEITLVDLQKKKKLFDIYFSGPEDFIVVTPDHYYWATSEALTNIRFSNADQSFPFQQFDLIYNRPDRVLSQLDGVDPKLIDAYYKAYQKRLQKLGFNESDLQAEGELPTLNIQDSDIAMTSSQEQINLEIEAQDEEHYLDRINIWVNDVPLYGRNGLSLKGKQTRTYQEAITIPLSPGKNRITATCLNEKGMESLVDEVDITFTGSSTKPDLYLIVFGASKYENAAMNLNYAAKDAEEIADLFSTSQSLFNQVHTEIFLDEAVTLDKLKIVKQKLQNSKTNDVVIIYFAGHGLVSSDLDYYLATYDVDFSTPERDGISYSALEDLLDNIPARKRLMFLDACFSGEIDKDNVAQIKNQNTPDGSLTFRSYDTQLVSKQVGLQNSFELMKHLFIDLRRGTGATVISSASGVEFALEGEKWQNGVFTYALLEGLQGLAADLDDNRQVMVSELQSFLAKRVQQLTNNQQRPTFRIENISYDWRVW